MKDLGESECPPLITRQRRRRYRINLSRHVYNEQEFTESFINQEEYTASSEFEPSSFAKTLRRNFLPSRCTCKEILQSWFPIVEWLPAYNVRRDLAHDIAGGITVAIMHIPQGLAYALLASLPAVTGLYTAFVPILVYMAMGTSRHISLGTFAVVCLMVGHVVDREVEHSLSPTPTAPATTNQPPGGSTGVVLQNSIYKHESDGSSLDEQDLLDEKKLEVAVALSMLVGLLQLLMGLFKLGFVAVYLSDPIISGFTTGAAILVFTSQVKHILGLEVPRYSGAFAVVKTYLFMFKNITLSVPGSVITGVVCILILIALKYISEKLKHKMKFPIPAELIVVVLGTVVSYFVGLNEKFQVSVLHDIPKGLRVPSAPSFMLMGNIVTDAIVISIVIFATNISLAKTFAKRNNYVIDSNQELIACGSANVLGSFFSCFPVSGSLSRSVIQESIARTQLCSIPVVVVIIMVLLFIAPLFYHLPKAILAAVVVVALKGLFRQFSRLVQLWRMCKPDAVVWFAAWLGVVLLGIDIGLGVGVIMALLVVIWKSSRPPASLLGQIPNTGIYRDIQRIPSAQPIPGIKIFRFESAMFYANSEYFRSTLIEMTGVDPQNPNKRSRLGSSAVRYRHREEDTGGPAIEITRTVAVSINRAVENGDVEVSLNDLGNQRSPSGYDPIPTHAIIIDASTFNFIDTQGVNTLLQLGVEYEKIGVKFYLAHCRYHIREMLEKAGFTARIGTEHLFVSVHDAVTHAVGIHSEDASYSSPVMSDTESALGAGPSNQQVEE
ncbi:sulfate anion transporter 1-like isoform X2 [Stylophora pistillata]|uniref:Solute carrier family 26 member 6 n=1 Tax=Stylophora pistillata TaxID=50429 RepID=A0A0G2SJ99_STYPI|nr:sulfate anion transporter 1-like isoform X2 [Stylophora pistillata]AJQ31793.1 solute carrier family 26 member alpha [Stylophora pistillata]PFX33452.1 Solute carrier family 26 member 6 [Stylophora pistillata]